VFKWPFLWDDFDFLGRVHKLRLGDFLPDPSLIFYRPLSREVYFWVIDHLFGASPLAAHILNAAVVCATIFLLVSLVRKLEGKETAILSGLIFACSAALPLSIGWASAGQDLLCALFAVLALHLQVDRKPVAAAASMALALLSKETAIAAIPALLAVSLMRPTRSRGEFVKAVGLLGTVVFLWVLVQPWMHSMLSRAAPEAGSYNRYIFRGKALLPALVQGVAISLNSPWIGRTPSFPGHILVPAMLATVQLVFVLTSRVPTNIAETPAHGDSPSALVLGAILWGFSIVATSLVLGGWSPHYVTIPALGMSMAAGTLLARVPRVAQVIAPLAFLWLGVGLRGNPIDPIVPTEPNFRETAIVLTKVRHGFQVLHTTFPESSNVFVSVQTRQSGGLYRHLFRFQPLRVWYRRPDLWVLDPNRRTEDRPNEFLFWIDPDLLVYEIRVTDLAPRGLTEKISLPRYQKTLRGYALGLAGSGHVDRAVSILVGMPEVDKTVWAFDRRTAAAVLLTAGRTSEAESVLVGVPVFVQPQATEGVVALLAEPVIGLDLDQGAMLAFGLNPNDLFALQSVMRRLDASGYKLAAGRFANRIQLMIPGEQESAAVLRRVEEKPSQMITVPIPYDIPQ
jgi:hypothetical protein